MIKIFDAHFHIINPAYPLVENNGFLPDAYLTEDYLAELKELGLEPAGGALTSGSFQAYDQSYFRPTFKALGKDYVGVSQVEPSISDAEVLKLNEEGVKAVRFNLYRGLTYTPEEIEAFANRVYDLCGWKTEFYLDLTSASDEIIALLKRLPKTSIDHLGMNANSTQDLVDLVTAGVAVRACGFGRVDHKQEDIPNILRALYDAAPDKLMFATDLPSTRARVRFDLDDIKIIQDTFNKAEQENIFYKNGADWYLN